MVRVKLVGEVEFLHQVERVVEDWLRAHPGFKFISMSIVADIDEVGCSGYVIFLAYEENGYQKC